MDDEFSQETRVTNFEKVFLNLIEYTNYIKTGAFHFEIR